MPGHTRTPSVWNDGMELACDTERYSDDTVVPAATEESLVAMLSPHDAVAANFRVQRVLSKEEYLYIMWSGRAGATKAILHAEYGKATEGTNTTASGCWAARSSTRQPGKR